MQTQRVAVRVHVSLWTSIAAVGLGTEEMIPVPPSMLNLLPHVIPAKKSIMSCVLRSILVAFLKCHAPQR